MLPMCLIRESGEYLQTDEMIKYKMLWNTFDGEGKKVRGKAPVSVLNFFHAQRRKGQKGDGLRAI